MSGYFLIEAGEVKLRFKKKQGKESLAKLVLGISNGFDVIVWQSPQESASSFSSDSLPLVLQEDEGNDGSEGVTYTVNFNSLLVKSVMLDLNNDVMNALANAVITIQLVSVADSSGEPEPPAAKGKKDASPRTPSEEKLFEISVPLANALKAQEFNISLDSNVTFPDSSKSEDIDPANCSFSCKLISDNDLATYCLGSKIFTWSEAILKFPPSAWALQAPDVVDPKAKAPAGPEELRAQYLEKVPKLIESGGETATYTISIGGGGGGEGSTEEKSNEGGGEGEESPIQDIFPEQKLVEGAVGYDSEAAAAVPLGEDIRARVDLWTVTWTASPPVFLHRSLVRRLQTLITKDPDQAFLSLTIKRSPGPNMEATQGAELICSARLNIADIIQPGCSSVSLLGVIEDLNMGVSAGGGGGEGEEKVDPTPAPLLSPALSVNYSNFSPLLLAKPTLKIPTHASSVVYVASNKLIASTDPNRDMLKEMRDELLATITRIGQEYVAQFPNAPVTESGKDNTGPPKESLEERKIEFLKYINTTGVRFELMDKLRMKVEVLVKDRCGPRGRALGKSSAMLGIDKNLEWPLSNEMSSLDNGDITAGSTVPVLLDELYTAVMKETTMILNGLFHDTLIDRSPAELSKDEIIEDEKSTEQQIFASLLVRAIDAANNDNTDFARKIHLERIQLVNHSVTFGSKAECVHSVYARFGEFLLNACAQSVNNVDPNPTSSSNPNSKPNSNSNSNLNAEPMMRNHAREALYLSYNVDQLDWKIGLLYASVLIECDQQVQAELVLSRVIEVQVAVRGVDHTLTTFMDFDGYETDKLCPVHPRCYAVLAAMFSMQNEQLKARKALALANRCYLEGDYEPPVSQHGKPRRTIVLVLAETALYLFDHALYKLAQECYILASDCEDAVAEKAAARGLQDEVPAHIKCTRLRAKATYLASGDARASGGSGSGSGSGSSYQNESEALAAAKESTIVAEDKVDEAHALITLAYIQQQYSCPVEDIMQTYLAIAEVAAKIPMQRLKTENIVPIRAYVQGAKLLLSAGRYEDCVSFLLGACQVYSSSGLFMFLGVAYLRMEAFGPAEDALKESSLLENSNPLVWAYLTLLCLLSGSKRSVEGERYLTEALRLELKESSLLRELATANMANNQLGRAEDLIRRAIRHENQTNARTKKLLADILASQNNTVDAIAELQSIIEDNTLERNERLEAGERCLELFTSLGKKEECNAMREFMYFISEEAEH